MFDNSGEKIENIAKFFCVISIIVCVIGGIVLIGTGSTLNSDRYTKGQGTSLIWIGFCVMFLGSFLSWVSSLMIAGFGHLITYMQCTKSNTDEILRKLERIESAKPSENTSGNKSNKWEEQNNAPTFDDLPNI